MPVLPEIRDHQRWLGYLQPEGLVVSPAALVDSGAVFNRSDRPLQQRFLEHLRLHQSWDGTSDPFVNSLPDFLTDFLDWETGDYLSGEAIPESLTTYIPAYRETLRPTHAVIDPEESEKCLLLILETSASDFDKPADEDANGWHVSPSLRLERILQDTGVGIGLLSNGTHFRLISAPPGENAGSLTFPIASMVEIPGRAILSGFHLLLDGYRLFQASENDSLSGILKKSRDYQANVSTDLAAQVLDGLYELLRGLQAAHAKSDRKLLGETLAKNPDAIYEAQLNVLMRLVFLLFAEDRNLMPGSSLYLQNYGVHALYDQLRKDRDHFPDTMVSRYGAWARLLSLFRLVHSGSNHADVSMPARSGYLFDPARFPFLEARDNEGELADRGLPKIPDSTICTVLEKLLYLKGEKLSYRTLDVEQIGSVYETMMGFRLLVATGPTIALNPKKKGGAPTNINLDDLLATPEKELKKWFKTHTDRDLTANQLKDLKVADSHTDILAALERIVAKNATPQIAHAGSLLLQPSDARRKSGSHYTPRKLTKPIVEKALEPLFAQLGENPAPEQILELKVCDPAVGSGAFLVEACRQLGDKLVYAWESHQLRPRIPSDETDILHARRLIAQRCLYGVDRNRMASDLAKLSLWLATLAKDHPFTFLDHSIRWGDSLVGLNVAQIRAFHWDTTHKTAQNPQLGEEKLGKRIKEALKHRHRILTGDDFLSPELKSVQLAAADKELDKVRLAGDLTILSFFSSSKKGDRQDYRDQLLGRWLLSEKADKSANPEELREALEEGIALKAETQKAREGEKPIHPFHWQIEFPEVFESDNPGFSSFVGNPPFAGVVTLAEGNHDSYTDFLRFLNPGTGGKCDLVAFFFRRCWLLIKETGVIGFLSTNTICEGDTRRSSLTLLLESGAIIYEARRSFRWPGQANVYVCSVHLTSGSYRQIILDGKKCNSINSFLLASDFKREPFKLAEGIRKAFVGAKPGAKWHVVGDPEAGHLPQLEVDRIVNDYPEEADGIREYIGGAELYDDPHQRSSRRISYLGLLDKIEVTKYLRILELLKTTTKKKLPLTGDWWQFSRRAVDLYKQISNYSHVLVRAEVSNTFAFARIQSKGIFSNKCLVFLFDEFWHFACLQSQVHEFWARLTSGTQGLGLSYVPNYSLATFPFPRNRGLEDSLSRAGEDYYDHRSSVMTRLGEGLTDTYNRLNLREESLPSIIRLRELHTAMDRAVLDAYGWSDISTDCEFIPDFTEEDDEGNIIEKNIRYRWPDEVRDEVLARLLALNAERHQEEVNAGLDNKGKKAKGGGKKTTRKRVAKKAAKKAAQIIAFPQDDELSFVATLNLPDWAAAVGRFSYPLPESPRAKNDQALAYYRLLIPAIIQTAGGQLPLESLFGAVESLEDRDQVTEQASPLAQEIANTWKKRFKEPLDPAAFGSALEDYVKSASLIRLVGSSNNPSSLQLRLSGNEVPVLPWHLLDAQIILTAQAITEQKAEKEISAEQEALREKLIPFATSA